LILMRFWSFGILKGFWGRGYNLRTNKWGEEDEVSLYRIVVRFVGSKAFTYRSFSR
jgi:hypothetical protein